MYAAAGGASLASRQARQRQRQQNKTRQLQARLHPALKAHAIDVAAGTPTRIQQPSRQFHQLPTSYLRTPQAQARKLSAGYTAQSKLLLPIDEGDGQSLHSHHVHHTHDIPGKITSPKLIHRHSGSGVSYFHHSHLHKSATATLPLVSQVDATPPTTPLIAVNSSKPPEDDSAGRMQITVPHDTIIVTPATPMASPGHVGHEVKKDSIDEESSSPIIGPLERKCSVYRMRRSDAFEQDFLDNAKVSQKFESYTDETNLIVTGLPNGSSGGHKWQQCAYCEEGICLCEHIECAQGRAAWLERGRRCSVQDNNPTACHRRWVKRNRIQDASLGGSSDDDDFLGVLRGPSTFANAFLYVGLGTIALGLVIAFVGTGEKGFKTVELRLIGPSLIGLGLICCILRILFCICPSHCISSNKQSRKKQGNKVDADHTTSLLRGESKRVSIARGPHSQKYPITHKKGNNKMLNEGMEALRQIATTSLFLQNEQKPSLNRVVPIIKEPEKPTEPVLEMKKLESIHNVEVSEDIHSTTTVTVPASCSSNKSPLERSSSKLSRQRTPINSQYQQQVTTQTSTDSGDLLMETSLMVLKPPTNAATMPSPSIHSIASTSTSPSIAKQSKLLPLHLQQSINSNFDFPPSIPHKSFRPVEAPHSQSTVIPKTSKKSQLEQHILPGQVIEVSNVTPSASKAVISSLPSGRSREPSTRTTSNLSVTISSKNTTLANAPAPTSTTNLGATLNFEPELLLSPAKLGQ